MKRKQRNVNQERLPGKVKPTKIFKDLNDVRMSPHVIEQMERGRKIIAEAGLPKIPGR